MSSLSSEITHSLLFLNTNIRFSNKIHQDTYQILNAICAMAPMEDGYSGKIKSRTTKFNEDTESDFSTILIDYKIYREEISFIKSNTSDELVIRTRTKYMTLYNTYKRLYKNMCRLLSIIEQKKEIANRNNNLVLVIAINKLSFTFKRSMEVNKRIINDLSVFTE